MSSNRYGFATFSFLSKRFAELLFLSYFCKPVLCTTANCFDIYSPVLCSSFRLDSEISRIQQSLNKMKSQKSAGERGKNSSEAQSLATLKVRLAGP